MNCKKCKSGNHEVNLFGGLCHSCWGDENPNKTCEGCYYARFYINCECESCIICDYGINHPMDCHSRDSIVPCEHKIYKNRLSDKDTNIGDTVFHKQYGLGRYMKDVGPEYCIVFFDNWVTVDEHSIRNVKVFIDSLKSYK